MAQYNSLNIKLSNSQFDKLKSAIENETEVVLRLSSNMVGDDETSFLILSYQKIKYLRWYNQEDFLVDFLVHY